MRGDITCAFSASTCYRMHNVHPLLATTAIRDTSHLSNVKPQITKHTSHDNKVCEQFTGLIVLPVAKRIVSNTSRHVM